MQSEQINRFLVVTQYTAMFNTQYFTFCPHSEFLRLVLLLTINISYIHTQYSAIGIQI